jgi:hypothetical protein
MSDNLLFIKQFCQDNYFVSTVHKSGNCIEEQTDQKVQRK